MRDDQREPVSGVTVLVWASDDVRIGHGVTDDKGVALITLYGNYPVTTYRITLSNLPAGYQAEKEYQFSSTTVNITIRKAAIQNEADHSEAQYDVGKTMTNFTLTDTDGNVYRLSDLLKSNQLVILDFWFATCAPCKGEFPYFEEAVKKYGDKITLLAINPIDSLQTIRNLREHYTPTITFPMCQDTCNLYLGFDVSAYPTTVFVHSNGQIMDIHLGAFATQEDLFAAIESYLY